MNKGHALQILVLIPALFIQVYFIPSPLVGLINTLLLVTVCHIAGTWYNKLCHNTRLSKIYKDQYQPKQPREKK